MFFMSPCESGVPARRFDEKLNDLRNKIRSHVNSLKMAAKERLATFHA